MASYFENGLLVNNNGDLGIITDSEYVSRLVIDNKTIDLSKNKKSTGGSTAIQIRIPSSVQPVFSSKTSIEFSALVCDMKGKLSYINESPVVTPFLTISSSRDYQKVKINKVLFWTKGATETYYSKMATTEKNQDDAKPIEVIIGDTVYTAHDFVQIKPADSDLPHLVENCSQLRFLPSKDYFDESDTNYSQDQYDWTFSLYNCTSAWLYGKGKGTLWQTTVPSTRDFSGQNLAMTSKKLDIAKIEELNNFKDPDVAPIIYWLSGEPAKDQGISTELRITNNNNENYALMSGAVSSFDISGYSLFETFGSWLTNNLGSVSLSITTALFGAFVGLFLKEQHTDKANGEPPTDESSVDKPTDPPAVETSTDEPSTDKPRGEASADGSSADG